MPQQTLSTDHPASAATGACPECDGVIAFARAPLAGQVVTCVGCGAELEVTSRDPLRLEAAPEVEEDWGE
ncbi:MAG: lysine biosynthesis protein LysW [Phycisphaerales bacterium]|nr:lysine biosynthesis protein LysW [Phycisphaerales bacterium]